MAVRNQLAYTFGALFFIALGGGLFGKGLAGYLNNNGIKEPVPLIEISPISHDFGNLGENDNPSFRFSIKNTSSGPVEVADILKNCGCVLLDEYKGKVINKSHTFDITGKWSLFKKSGKVQEKIVFLIRPIDNKSALAQPYSVNLNAQVFPNLIVEKERIEFKGDSPQQVKVRVQPGKRLLGEIDKIFSSSETVKVKLEVDDKNRDGFLVVDFIPDGSKIPGTDVFIFWSIKDDRERWWKIPVNFVD